MNKKIKAPTHNEANVEAPFKVNQLYLKRMRNAILKGTYLGTLFVTALGFLALKVNLEAGAFLIMAGGLYGFLFTDANRDYIAKRGGVFK